MVLIHFGWRASFAATGILSLLYFWAFWVVYRDPEDDGELSAQERILINESETRDELDHGPSLGALMKRKKVIGLSLVSSLTTIVSTCCCFGYPPTSAGSNWIRGTPFSTRAFRGWWRRPPISQSVVISSTGSFAKAEMTRWSARLF